MAKEPDRYLPPDAVRPYRHTPLAVAALCLPVLGFWLPFLGFFASLALALNVVPRAGARLWAPARGRRQRVALLGFGAMWLPAVLALSGVFLRGIFSSTLGHEVSAHVGNTAWLLIPLCAPEQIIMPTLAASAVYVAGAGLSGLLHHPWPWVLGALLSALSYDLVLVMFSIVFSC